MSQMRHIVGGFIIWFSFGTFASILYKVAGIGKDWFKALVLGFGFITLIALLGAGMVYGLYLLDAPL